MHKLKGELYIGIIVMFLLLGNMGCAKMVDGYKKFHIYGFEDFFSMKKLEDQKEYIASGKLDLYEKEDIIFIPFIKEISDTECTILLFPYSQNVNNKVVLNEMELMTSEGNMICFIEDFGEIDVLPEWNDSMTIVTTFDKSDEWFYNGNNLTLKINISIEQGNASVDTEITYDVVIVGYRGTSLQV